MKKPWTTPKLTQYPDFIKHLSTKELNERVETYQRTQAEADQMLAEGPIDYPKGCSGWGSPDVLDAYRIKIADLSAQLADANALMEPGAGARNRCWFCGRFPPLHWGSCQYAAYLIKWSTKDIKDEPVNTTVSNQNNGRHYRRA